METPDSIALSLKFFIVLKMNIAPNYEHLSGGVFQQQFNSINSTLILQRIWTFIKGTTDFFYFFLFQNNYFNTIGFTGGISSLDTKIGLNVVDFGV